MLRFTRGQPGTAGVRSAMMRRWKVNVGRGVFTVLVMMTSSAGDRHAALAQSDQRGSDTMGNSEQMIRLEHEAAKGLPAKEVELANHYFAGEGAPKNMERAAFWYEKAARAGDPVAENAMGCLTRAGLGVPEDASKALNWFRLAASGGLPEAWLNIGRAYLIGSGTGKDPAAAAEYFQRALAKRVGLAASYLGLMSLAGIGQPKDAAAAEKWYRQGMALHDPASAFNLSLLYTIKPGHEHNLAKAIGPLRESADSGFGPAMHSLALLTLRHPELSRKSGEVEQLLRGAENAGYWRSSTVLGILARDGNGVPADPSQAYLHFRIAVLEGGGDVSELLRTDLERLSAVLTATETERLDSQAARWIENHPRQPVADSEALAELKLEP
jgi:TPR repeat protein